MIFFYKIKESIKSATDSMRSFLIKEKEKYISAKIYDEVNFNFKNLSPYSELNLYKSLFLLIFIFIFLIILLYYTCSDFKTNINKNQEIRKIQPLEITIKNPVNMYQFQNYDNAVHIVKNGDNLLNILINSINLSTEEAYICINELSKIYDIKNIKQGQKIYFRYRSNLVSDNNKISNKNLLDELKIIDDQKLKEYTISRNSNNKFELFENDINLTTTYSKYIINIKNSLYSDALTAGMPLSIVANLINYYSFDVDFQRDIRSGDKLEVVFEVFYTESGKQVGIGNIIFANFYVNKENHYIYKFDGENLNGYYDENGLSTQKSLLKTPINGARITSDFKTKRKHPVLGYTRAHKGIDFGAPVGTPFYAAGNGTVRKIINYCKNGNKNCGGGFGNYVLIQHNNTYSTEYAHISKIHKSIKVGSKVKQGDVLAYVGTTGLSSGPHLHYGVIFKGQRINPKRIKSISSTKLIGKNLIKFIEQKEKIDLLRDTAINQSK